ncbi:hypothetical protein [Bryobacter aggregatus]|uniref:hypothetical protein n=1 Tax=Bryobacter aggregatus TaxID=360054 RepID=UPI0004E18D93|nr:hypothetical protein [Bryobacter aggregatus]
MKRIALFLFPMLLLGQQNAPAPPPAAAAEPQVSTQASYHTVIEYEPDSTNQIHSFGPLIRPVVMQVEPLLKLISLTGPSKKDVDAAEQLIRRYYKPGTQAIVQRDRNVELTLQVLLATTGNESSSVPSSLDPVVNQLKQLTALKSFRVIETQIATVRSGNSVEVMGVLSWPEVPVSAFPLYQFQSKLSVEGKVVHLDKLRFSGRVPYQNPIEKDKYDYREVNILTALDVKPGQQVVVGKVNATVKDTSLILVVSVKLLD